MPGHGHGGGGGRGGGIGLLGYGVDIIDPAYAGLYVSDFGAAPPPPPPGQGIMGPQPVGTPAVPNLLGNVYSDPASAFVSAPAAPPPQGIPPQGPFAEGYNAQQIANLKQQCAMLRQQERALPFWGNSPQKAALRAQIKTCEEQLRAAEKMGRHHRHHRENPVLQPIVGQYMPPPQQYAGPQDPGGYGVAPPWSQQTIPGYQQPAPYYPPPRALQPYNPYGNPPPYGPPPGHRAWGGGSNYGDGGWTPPGGNWQPPPQTPPRRTVVPGTARSGAGFNGELPGPGGGYHTHGELGFSQKTFG